MLPTPLLLTVTGRDQGGVTAALTGVLMAAGGEVLDLEQVVVRGQLTLCLLVRLPAGGAAPDARVVEALHQVAAERAMTLAVRPMPADEAPAAAVQLAVTVVGDPVTTAGLHGVARVLAAAGGNIERIHRLSEGELSAVEVIVSLPPAAGDAGDDRLGALRRQLLAETPGLDVAVQRESLRRRSKRLVAMDMDSTLIEMEVIDELARRAGRGDEVAAITRRAMEGELDFEASLRARVATLAGLPTTHLREIAASLPLMEGAAELAAVLRRLGYKTAVISGGFTFAAEALRRQLGLDYAYANTLEEAGGVLTGRVRDPIVTPQRKADLLGTIAQGEGIDPSQTIAIGDGANDLPMLQAAGLGVAFHAKAKLAASAHTAISRGSLTRVLYLLGLRARDLVE